MYFFAFHPCVAVRTHWCTRNNCKTLVYFVYLVGKFCILTIKTEPHFRKVENIISHDTFHCSSVCFLWIFTLKKLPAFALLIEYRRPDFILRKCRWHDIPITYGWYHAFDKSKKWSTAPYLLSVIASLLS